MSWNKNAFSYLMWLTDTLIAGMLLIYTTSVLCGKAGFSLWMGIGFAAAYGIFAAVIVFKLCRWVSTRNIFAEKNQDVLLLCEGILVAILLFFGLFFRVQGIGSAELSSEYFEAARVTAGQRLPKIVHGASYLYVGMLHEIFVLLGNQFVAGIWVQITLQMAAFLLLFFMVRKLAGPLAALLTFGFFMCAPFAVQHALVLSPWMLYFLMFMLGFVLISLGYEKKVEPAVFFLKGILAAFLCYLDISGGLLLIAAIATALCSRGEESKRGRKLAASVLCVAGMAGGLVLFLFLDALLSGKTFQGVAGAWISLYRPETFKLPAVITGKELQTETGVLAGVSVFGIFSFWCDRKKEQLSPYVLAVCVVIAAGGFGILTQESQGVFCLFLLLTVLAGIGLKQCFQVEKVVQAEEKAVPQSAVSDDLVIEELTDISEKQESDSEQEKLRQEKALKAEFRKEQEKKVQYLENPLPLPRRHVKRVMDYPMRSLPGDDFDYPVNEEDDFDY